MTADPALDQEIQALRRQRDDLQAANNRYLERARKAEGLLKQAIVLLIEAAQKFRLYEASHRAKGTTDADRKAEVNAEIAGRIEVAVYGCVAPAEASS